MSFLKKILVLSIFVSLSTTLYADIFPRGCEVTGFGYNGTLLVFNEHGNQSYYLVKNRSNRNIELQRVETKEVFMSPPLAARLDSGNWAAFASDVPNQYFQCLYVESNNSQKVDCRDVLDVCQYPRAKFALSNMGNYWVSTNKDQRQIINDSAAKGIYLRW